MSIKQPSLSAGFTIVETLIVLAIGGLILLIVFEAIPTLERNSRNSQRRQDVASILQAVSHYELNHSGGFLDCATDCYGSGNLLSNAKLTYYSSNTQVQVVSKDAGRATPPDQHNPNSDIDTVYVYNHRLCSNDNKSETWVGAAYSDIVALYAVEGGSGVVSQCQQL